MFTKLFRVVLIAAIIAGMFASLAINPQPVQAQENQYQIVDCANVMQKICATIGSDQIASLKALSQYWGLYVTNGRKNYKYHETWIRNNNPAGWNSWQGEEFVPDQVMLGSSNVELPRMGIELKDGELYYHQPGYLLDSEVPIPLPNSGRDSWKKINLKNLPDIDWDGDFQLYESYYLDGTNLFRWIWVPEPTANGVTLNVIDLTVGFLEEVKHLPKSYVFDYDQPADIDWIPGEALRIASVNMNSRRIAPTYEVTLQDISWYWEDELQRLLDQGMDDTQAWDRLLKSKGKEIKSWIGTKPNYKNTTWRATVEWVDNYVILKGSEAYRIADHALMTSRACTSEEHCYSTSYTPQVGEIVYVYPYTLDDNWRARQSHHDWSNLWVLNVYPGRIITKSDSELLQSRIDAGEVKSFRALLLEPEDLDGDGELDIVYQNGNGVSKEKQILPSFIGDMPPINHAVYVWVYTDKAVTKYDSNPEGKVAAIFDTDGTLWYFNNYAEKGQSFDAETYGVSCGGMMAVNLYFEDCIP